VYPDLYKRILDIVGWEPSCPPLADPFHGAKTRALAGAKDAILALPLALAAPSTSLPGKEGHGEEEGHSASHSHWRCWLLVALLGNRGDLSHTGGEALVHTLEGAGAGDPEVGHPPRRAVDSEVDAMQASLLVDHVAAAAGALSALGPGQVVTYALDNAGLELACDLCFMDAILSASQAVVVVHAKDAPVFVSDATCADVAGTIAWLAGPELGSPVGAAISRRLTAAIASGRLVVQEHAFYTSPLPTREAPPDLVATLAASALYIVKGDAAFRRLVGDRHVAHTLPAEEALAYAPCPLLALRTCKSGVLFGAKESVVAAARAGSPEGWLTDGRNGVVMFVRGRGPG
jgi:hypothetical protein